MNSYERLEMIFQYAPDAIFLIDNKGKVLDLNKAAEVLTGLKKERLVGKSGFELGLLTAAQTEKAFANLIKIFKGKSVGPDGFYLVSKEGKRIPVEINTFPVKIEGQTVVLGIARDITERKKSEERYKELVEKAGIAILVDDREGNVIYANRKAAEIYGYSLEEMKGQSIQSLVHLDDREKVKKFHQDRLQEKDAPSSYEFRALRKDGSDRFLEIESITNIEEGSIVGTRIYIKDITERKRAAEALKKSEERFRRLFNRVFDPIIIIENYRVVDVNEAACKLLGYSREECLKLYVKDIHPKEEMEKIKAAICRAKESGTDFMGETALLSREGKAIPVEAGGVTFELEGKTYVMGSFRDITERKKAERILRESEEKYRELVNTSVDGVISIDNQMKIILWNPATERMFGYTEKEMLGQSLETVVPEKYWIANKKAFLEFQKRGSGKLIGETLEIEGKRKDGTEFPIELSISPRSVDGEYVATAIIRNITERKKAEEVVRKRKNQLELVHRIQNDIPMNMNIETILKAAAESIGRSFGYNKVSVNIFDESRNELEYIVGWHQSGAPTPKDHRQKVGEGLIGKAAELRKTIIVNDITKEPSYVVYNQFSTQSELSIPLLVGDQLVGILDIQDLEKNVFTEDDVSVLQSVANYLAYVVNEKQIEEQLKVSLKEKEVLLREIHHRVKNNLQVISSLLSIQSHHISGKENIEIFRASQDRVKSMALIHEKLYQSRDLARINSREYIQALVNGLYRSYSTSPEKVDLELDVEDISLAVDCAIPCGLILNELVSNSLKHAFPNGREGKIRVVLRSVNQNDIELLVSDNGVGLPENLDIRKTKSLGLHLVTILAEDQLQGEIKLNKSEGTEFRIKLRGER